MRIYCIFLSFLMVFLPFSCSAQDDIQDEDSFQEEIIGESKLSFPNAFSPNGDGTNDRLCFKGDFITYFYIAIYTRWGEKVFETHDIHDCWDGRYNDNWCMPGVYTYTCQIRCEAGQQNYLKGDITLIR